MARQKVCNLNIDYPIKIKMIFCHGDERKRDSDNACSSILDLLKDCRLIVDDNWKIVQKIEIENIFEKNNPFCKLTIDKIKTQGIIKL